MPEPIRLMKILFSWLKMMNRSTRVDSDTDEEGIGKRVSDKEATEAFEIYIKYLK